MAGKVEDGLRWLCLDTATVALTVALADDSRIVGETTTMGARDHSVRLFPVVADLLNRVGWSMEHVEGILVGDGPGSYTGVRIGVAAAKGWGYALRVPVVGVSTLSVMAHSHAVFPGLVCPLIDARRSRVYGALYASRESSKPGRDVMTTAEFGPMRDVLPEQVGSVEELAVRVQEATNRQPVLFVGDGAEAYREILARTLQGAAHFAAEGGLPSIRAAGIIKPGLHAYREGSAQGLSFDAGQLLPRYLQKVEAEQKLEREREVTQGERAR